MLPVKNGKKVLQELRNILWQQGTPSEHADKLGKESADMALQVYDIDRDGKDET